MGYAGASKDPQSLTPGRLRRWSGLDHSPRYSAGRHHVGAAHHAAATTETGAVHDGNGRLGKFIEQLHGAHRGHGGSVGLLRRALRSAGKPVDVGAGLEMLPGAAEHEGAHSRVWRQALQAGDEGCEHVLVIRIAAFGSVERGRGDAARIDGEQDLVTHGSGS